MPAASQRSGDGTSGLPLRWGEGQPSLSGRDNPCPDPGTALMPARPVTRSVFSGWAASDSC
jgi:hypothetical protein